MWMHFNEFFLLQEMPLDLRTLSLVRILKWPCAYRAILKPRIDIHFL